MTDVEDCWLLADVEDCGLLTDVDDGWLLSDCWLGDLALLELAAAVIPLLTVLAVGAMALFGACLMLFWSRLSVVALIFSHLLFPFNVANSWSTFILAISRSVGSWLKIVFARSFSAPVPFVLVLFLLNHLTATRFGASVCV